MSSIEDPLQTNLIQVRMNCPMLLAKLVTGKYCNVNSLLVKLLTNTLDSPETLSWTNALAYLYRRVSDEHKKFDNILTCCLLSDKGWTDLKPLTMSRVLPK